MLIANATLAWDCSDASLLMLCHTLFLLDVVNSEVELSLSSSLTGIRYYSY